MKIWFRFELVCVVMHLESLCLQSTDERLYNIELQRGARGFGFSIRGGREFNNMPLFILKIADGGSAHTDGRLRVRCNCFLIWYGEFTPHHVPYILFAKWITDLIHEYSLLTCSEYLILVITSRL